MAIADTLAARLNTRINQGGSFTLAYLRQVVVAAVPDVEIAIRAGLTIQGTEIIPDSLSIPIQGLILLKATENIMSSEAFRTSGRSVSLRDGDRFITVRQSQDLLKLAGILRDQFEEAARKFLMGGGVAVLSQDSSDVCAPGSSFIDPITGGLY